MNFGAMNIKVSQYYSCFRIKFAFQPVKHCNLHAPVLLITLACRPSVLNPSFSVFFDEKSSLR